VVPPQRKLAELAQPACMRVYKQIDQYIYIHMYKYARKIQNLFRHGHTIIWEIKRGTLKGTRMRRQIWVRANIRRTCNSNKGRKDLIGVLGFCDLLRHNPSETMWGGASRHTWYLCLLSSTSVIERNIVSFAFNIIFPTS